jgi:hypothetical protein
MFNPHEQAPKRWFWSQNRLCPCLWSYKRVQNVLLVLSSVYVCLCFAGDGALEEAGFS